MLVASELAAYYKRVHRMYLCPVGMLFIQNVRAGDFDVLPYIWYGNVIRIVLAGGYCVSLGRPVYTDYLNHEVTVLVIVVGAVSEITVSLIQAEPDVKVSVLLLDNVLNCSGSGYARHDNL